MTNCILSGGGCGDSSRYLNSHASTWAIAMRSNENSIGLLSHFGEIYGRQSHLPSGVIIPEIDKVLHEPGVDLTQGQTLVGGL